MPIYKIVKPELKTLLSGVLVINLETYPPPIFVQDVYLVKNLLSIFSDCIVAKRIWEALGYLNIVFLALIT